MKLKKSTGQALAQQLKQFGLNPKEWKLKIFNSRRRNSAILTHKEDPEVKMMGHWAETNEKDLRSRYWLDLYLM